MNLNKTKCPVCPKKTSGFPVVTVEPQEFGAFPASREGKGSDRDVRVSFPPLLATRGIQLHLLLSFPFLY